MDSLIAGPSVGGLRCIVHPAHKFEETVDRVKCEEFLKGNLALHLGYREGTSRRQLFACG